MIETLICGASFVKAMPTAIVVACARNGDYGDVSGLRQDSTIEPAC